MLADSTEHGCSAGAGPSIQLGTMVKAAQLDMISPLHRLEQVKVWAGVFLRRAQLVTHPRCPPLLSASSRVSKAHQLAHTISVRTTPILLSSRRTTAPGTVSKNAGQPQPELLRLSAKQTRQSCSQLGLGGIQGSVAAGAVCLVSD